MIKVSIIVPIYNVEIYLEKCLNSLVNQTLKEIEIICVNDGSPDNSQDIVDSFCEKYPNKVKSFIKPNGGLSDARNFGLDYVKGEFIGFIDSDDWAELDAYELMYNKAESTSSDIVVCGINIIYSKTSKSNIVNAGGIDDGGNNLHDKKTILFDTFPNAWNKIYSKELFLETNIRFPLGLLYEDIGTIPALYLTAKKISAVHNPLINYVIDRSGNISQTYDNRLYDIFGVLSETNNHYKMMNQFDNFYNELEYFNIMPIFEAIRKLKFYSDKSFKLKFINYTFEYLNENYPTWKTNIYFKENLNQYNTKQKLLWRILMCKPLSKIYNFMR